MVAFGAQKVKDIRKKNHYSMKQNRIRTQDSIMRLWASLRGEVLTLPGQAGDRMVMLYYNITGGLRFPMYLVERDERTFALLERSISEYTAAVGDFINTNNIKLIFKDVADLPPVPCEDLDFCCTPGMVGRLVFARLQTQSLLPAVLKGFSFTTYEVAAHSNCIGDNVRLINNIIKFLGGTPRINPADIDSAASLHYNPYCVMKSHEKGPTHGGFCKEYSFPIAKGAEGRVQGGRWFRFRDKIGSISNTFALLYT